RSLTSHTCVQTALSAPLLATVPSPSPGACTGSSSPRTTPAAPRSSRSKRARRRPPPKSFLARPTAPTWYSSRHPPRRSSNPQGRALLATRENSRPSAPSLQSAPCARAADDAAAASVLDSRAPLPASSVAASRHPPPDRPQKPSVPPPASVRNARLPLRCTSLAPAAALSVETSRRERDSRAALRCGAARPKHLPPASVSTGALPADSSRASAALHPPHAAADSVRAPAPLLFATPPCSSPSAPI